jgi:endonuclease/exonuclease/phosphatase family metal-dependent hydrolase
MEVRKLELPIHAHRRTEPRRALMTRLEWPAPGKTVAVVNTHLSIKAAERPGQLAAIAELAHDDEVIVAGDLNCTPWSRALKVLRPKLRSATKHSRTWPARVPLFPIDHILVGGPMEVVEFGSWKSGEARRASDHLPVVAVLEAA